MQPAASPHTPAPSPIPAPTPEDVKSRLTIWISPHFWRWVAVGAAFFVVVLSFFTWVGYFPGGVPVRTQSAWQAAFGWEWVDRDLLEEVPKKAAVFEPVADLKKTGRPGGNGLLIFYVLLLIPLLLGTAAVAVWDLGPLKVPPVVEKLKPWRWGIVAGVALLALLLLVFQLIAGFSLESNLQATVQASVDRKLKEAYPGKAPAPASKEGRAFNLERGLLLSPLQRGGALRAALSLTVLLLISALLMFWLERRRNKPLPRIQVLS